MASSYPPPPTPDQQSFNPYQHAPAISSSQIREAMEAAGAAVQAVQPDPAHDQQTHDLSYTFPKVSQAIAEVACHEDPTPSRVQRQEIHANGAHQKLNRLRKACDSCSIRKVKACRGDKEAKDRCVGQLNAISPILTIPPSTALGGILDNAAPDG
ncbi:MAG: hypothetical protein M1822_005396 [Bathelium mastoideum]|nr:MAG: hypothetical protein M1822_005396 [Bathelium mastoideum]